MFTGIIQEIGEVVRVAKKGASLQLIVKSNSLEKSIKAGDSIAVNGVCLTVTTINKNSECKTQDAKRLTMLTFDVMPETVRRSTFGGLRAKDKVNIEPAIRAGEPFGGHFVQGHVDATGMVSDIKKYGDEYIMQISCHAGITKQMIEKGSVALDGVSLTVVDIQPGRFSVAIIPFTLTHTILGKKKAGDAVNIELDIIGKWIRKLLSSHQQPSYSDEGF